SINIKSPGEFLIDDSMVLPPSDNPSEIEVLRGPNIKPLPINNNLSGTLKNSVLLKLEDNITTDHIMPAGAKILPLRSNIPAISQYVFSGIDLSFPDRARVAGGGYVVGGHNYGQGSSREHAALAPMYLGIKAVIAKSFARIHRANLVNFGILPLSFADEKDYETVTVEDNLEIDVAGLDKGDLLVVKNTTKGTQFKVHHGLTPRQTEIIKAGGLLNYTKQQNA
ncbi:MAG: aconitate hydratase, partial [Eubacteriales bacterium]